MWISWGTEEDGKFSVFVLHVAVTKESNTTNLDVELNRYQNYFRHVSLGNRSPTFTHNHTHSQVNPRNH